MIKEIKFLSAINNNGKYFGLRESPSSTSPFECDHPYDAYKHFPYGGFEKLEKIMPATHYFENSSRMREWLKDYKMVIVKMKIIAEIERVINV
jgi:predicted metalloenzyme YecM